MANRPKGYGYSREVASKIEGKYSEDDELEVVSWIQSITQESPSGDGKEAFHEWLKDGQVLCKLINEIKPGSIKINPPSTSSNLAMRKNKEMENIGFFLKALGDYDIKGLDLFQTVDLYEGGNLGAVQTCLYKLSSGAKKKGYDGPCIGVKLADENPRDLSEEQLREGRNVIGLQMGTNQVASQSGMTAYGLGRQLTPNK